MQTVKQCIQSMLKRAGIYYRLKASSLYDLYWMFVNRRLIDGRNKEIDFYRSLLIGFQRGNLIFDVGANVGDKTDVFLRIGARVVAVEPDERNQEILRGKFLEHRLVPKPVIVVGQAVSDKIGVDTMWIDGPGSALNTLSQKWADTLRADKKRFEHTLDVLEFAQKKSVETTTLEQLSLRYGLPFFVKIDVEGHELNALRGLRHPVPYLSFEVNLPEFRQEGLRCVEVLGRLAVPGRFNYVSDCKSGLVLDQWADQQEFSEILDHCTERCIEVFWRTPAISESDV
jgi:FkbM family methyltransferase